MVFGFFHKDSAGRSPEQNSVADFAVGEADEANIAENAVGKGGGMFRGFAWLLRFSGVGMNTARKIFLPGRITWMRSDL